MGGVNGTIEQHHLQAQIEGAHFPHSHALICSVLLSLAGVFLPPLPSFPLPGTDS